MDIEPSHNGIHTMSRKALFADLLADAPHFKAELAKVAVAADLTVLLTQSGLTRAELAQRLGWSRARVTQVLSGQGNLTLETLHAVAEALGYAFDIVFRKPEEQRQAQAWERPMSLSLEMPVVPTRQGKDTHALRLVSSQPIPMSLTEQHPFNETLEWADAA
jgi:transcriptional regulator with XRE-family HTH domain